MSVLTTTNRVDYTGDGIATTFAFSFPVYQLGDLQVWTDDTGTATNAPEGLVLRVKDGVGAFDYIQSKVNFPGGVKGGTITFNSAPFTGMKVILLRVISETQPAQYTNFNKWDAKSGIEQSFDLLEMQIQQMKKSLDLALGFTVDAVAADPTLPPTTVPSICDQTKLLYHCDGVDKTAIVTDNSANAINFTVVAPNAIDTAQAKFGGSSLRLQTGDLVTTPDSAALLIGVLPWCIETWFRVDSTLNTPVQDRQTIWRWTDSGLIAFYEVETREWAATSGASGTFRLRGSIPDPGIVLDPNIILANTWYHIAMTRSIVGNIETIRFFLNGVQKYSKTQPIVTMPGPTAHIQFSSTANIFKGFIDEFRFVVGTPVFTSAFTPPTKAYDSCSAPTTDVLQIGVNSTGTDLQTRRIPAGIRSYTFNTSMSSRVITFTTPGAFTWVVPAGVTQVLFEMGGPSSGGGGGGANAYGSHGFNGTGGGWAQLFTTFITPGETIDILLGSPGLGGAANGSRGTNAGNSQVSRRAPNAADRFYTIPSNAAGGFGGTNGTSTRTGGQPTGDFTPEGAQMLGEGNWLLGMSPGIGYTRFRGVRGGRGGNGGYIVTQREIDLGENNIIDFNVIIPATPGEPGSNGYVAIYY